MSQTRLQKKYKRVIQLEFNEISREVIDDLIRKGKLPFFKKMNQEWSYFHTESENVYEEIEPWIQWTTAHTGKPLAEHKIFRLSDAPNLTCEQIWERLSKENIQSAVISPINAKRGDTKGGIFFPDPWSKYNDSYPENLGSLWRLISRKVQGHAVDPLATQELVEGMKTCLRFHLPVKLYLKIAKQLIGQKVSPLSKWKLAGIFDLFLFHLFERVLATTDFGFYSLFLNGVAHYQHHYWRNYDRKLFNSLVQADDLKAHHDPVTYGYQIYDKILGSMIRKFNRSDTLFIVASGLSQVPYVEKESEGGMNYYRLKRHEAFVRALGLCDHRVFPLMSRDWQIGGVSPQKLEEARKVLAGVSAVGKPLFQISQNTPDFLFIETALTEQIDFQEPIFDRNQKLITTFGEAFSKIAIKSGHHSGMGSMWCSEKASFQGSIPRIALASLFDLVSQALL